MAVRELVRRGGESVGTPVLAKTSTLTAMLDSVEANIFAADLNFDLVYMNRCAARTAATIEGEIRSTFGLGIPEMIGGSIHRFHRDPARVEAILRDPRNFPHRARFTFGAVTLDTQINAIATPDGVIHGYIVSWDDVSESERIAEMARELASQMADASVSLTQVGGELAGSSERSSAATETVAAASEEMTASILEISRTTSTAALAAEEATAVIRDGEDRMRHLEESTEAIGAIVAMISSIANQTNLLALNATIEAARAGDAGRGFAVVAGEVKDLSHETATATQQIEAVMASLRNDAENVAEAMRAVADVVRRIAEQQGTVAVAIEEQTATSSEIAATMSVVAGDVSATQSIASHLNDAARDLADRAAQLEGLVR